MIIFISHWDNICIYFSSFILLLIFQTGGSCEDEYPALPAYQPETEPQTKEVYIVQVKGLPWSCNAQDLLQFFSGQSLETGTALLCN